VGAIKKEKEKENEIQYVKIIEQQLLKQANERIS
jgi:hypothetical protein